MAGSPTVPGPRISVLSVALVQERAENCKIPRISGGVVAGWCAAHLGKVRFVHEFSGCDAASDRAVIGEKAFGLIRLPGAGGVAGARAYGE